MSASKDALQSPSKLTSQQKIALTDDAARKIIAAEVTARDKKTEKLKQLRLARVALETETVEPSVKKKKK